MAHNRMSKRNFTWLLTQCIFRVNMALAKANMPFSGTSIFFFLSPRIYHWLKILTTGICLIFYWLLMTGKLHVHPGNPQKLFEVSNVKNKYRKNPQNYPVSGRLFWLRKVGEEPKYISCDVSFGHCRSILGDG